MVSSSSPRAIFPEDVWPKVHDPGSEKSSWRITAPKSSRLSGVGVMGKVGTMVGVDVAGNHSTVAVIVGVVVGEGVLSIIGT
jgi:hypothetical protein